MIREAQGRNGMPQDVVNAQSSRCSKKPWIAFAKEIPEGIQETEAR